MRGHKLGDRYIYMYACLSRGTLIHWLIPCINHPSQFWWDGRDRYYRIQFRVRMYLILSFLCLMCIYMYPLLNSVLPTARMKVWQTPDYKCGSLFQSVSSRNSEVLYVCMYISVVSLLNSLSFCTCRLILMVSLNS